MHSGGLHSHPLTWVEGVLEIRQGTQPGVKIMPNAHQSTLLGAFDVNFAKCSIQQYIFPNWKLSLATQVPNNVKCSSTFLGALDRDSVSDCNGGISLTFQILQAQTCQVGSPFYLSWMRISLIFKIGNAYKACESINACHFTGKN